MSDQDSFVNGIEIIDTTLATSSTASLYTFGGISILGTSDATDLNNGGSFLTLGGMVINKSTLMGGVATILNSTQSVNSTTGALQIRGGIGISGNLFGNFGNFTTLQATTSATIANLIGSNVTITNLSLTGAFSPANITTSNLVATTATIPNSVFTNISSGNILTTNLITTNTTVSNSNITNSTISNIVGTNSTISNMLGTNLSLSNSTISNLLVTNETTTNLIVSTSTKLNTVTSANILITNSLTSNILTIDAKNSTTNPAQILFLNTAANGDFKISGDGGDVQWQGGGSRALQMGAYHQIILLGGRVATTAIPFQNGSSGSVNTIIQNSNDSISLRLVSNATQTANLTEWTDSSGTVLTNINNFGGLTIRNTSDTIGPTAGGSIITFGGVSIGKSLDVGSTANATNVSSGAMMVAGGAGFNGDIYANDIYSNNIKLLPWGSGYHYTENLVTANNTAITFTLRSSITTSSLLAGTYHINLSYVLGAGSSATQNTEFLAILDATAPTTGTTLVNTIFRPSATTQRVEFSKVETVTLTAGVHNVGVLWRTSVAGQAAIIDDVAIELYRIF